MKKAYSILFIKISIVLIILMIFFVSKYFWTILTIIGIVAFIFIIILILDYSENEKKYSRNKKMSNKTNLNDQKIFNNNHLLEEKVFDGRNQPRTVDKTFHNDFIVVDENTVIEKKTSLEYIFQKEDTFIIYDNNGNIYKEYLFN